MPSHDSPSILTAWPTPGGLVRAAACRPLSAAAVAGLLGVAAGFALWQLNPPRYHAEVRLRVERAPAGIADQGGGHAEAELPAQAELIKSPAVLRHAAEEPELAKMATARGWAAPELQIAACVQVEAIPHDSAVRIRAVDTTAADALVVARATANAYLKELKDRRQRRLQQLKDALAHDAATAAKEEPVPTPALPRVVDPRLGTAEAELAQVQADHRKAVAELAALRSAKPAPTEPVVSEQAVDQAFRNDAYVQRKQQELKPLEDRIQAFLRVAALGEKEPSLQSHLARRDALRKELDARRATIRKTLQEKASATVTEPDVQPQIKALEERVAGLARQEQALEEELRSLRAAAQKVVAPPPVVRVPKAPDSEKRHTLEAEIRAIEAHGVEPYWVTPVGETQSVDAPSIQRRQSLAGLGGAGGALLGLLFVGFAEFGSRRVRTARDVSEGLAMPVFGALPRLKASGKALAAAGPTADAVDALRTALLDSLASGPCVILVTGSGAGVDKSALAAHLAASMARSWHKTVLIDGNLRRPELQAQLAFPSGPGLAEVLRGEAEAFDVLHPTGLNRLWVMSAGRLSSAPDKALADGDIAGAFEPLKDQYDCVIVDAASVGMGADMMCYGPHVDAAVLAVGAGVSRLPEVHAARQVLEPICPVVGAVVLGAAGAWAATTSAARQQQTAAAA